MTQHGDANGPAQPRAADVSGVPDGALRSALEFAVGIAAAGQKVRPPLVYPPALKPYLKSNRLDAAALRAVRRAVVADEPFRDRLGLVDSSDLVDALGTAWLRRDEGWEDDIHRQLAAAREQAAEALAEAALRKSERRRDAAEQVAARAQAELIGHHEALARETNRRDKAENQARTALAQVTGLREEIIGLRREADRLRSKLQVETERTSSAERQADDAGRRLAEAERVRDELLARRSAADSAGPNVAIAAGTTVGAHPPAAQPVVTCAVAPPAAAANAQAARALQQAAASTRELTAALLAAGEALEEQHGTTHEAGPARHARSGSAGMPPVKPLRPRNDRRKPIPIPGGLHGDSVAAADHMLRVPNVCVLVDGYNLAKLAWPQLELMAQRDCCIDLLEDLVRRLGTDVRVVFDGADVVGASAPRRLIRVQFSPPGVSADDVIRDEVRALPALLPAVVVTNDQAIVNDMRAAGANVVSSDTLLVLAGRSVPRCPIPTRIRARSGWRNIVTALCHRSQGWAIPDHHPSQRVPK